MSRDLKLLTGGLQPTFLNLRSMALIAAIAAGAGFLGSVLSLRRFLRYR
jgi:hypothetical protein